MYHFYNYPNTRKKHLDKDFVGNLQADSVIVMSLKMDKLRILIGNFRMFGLSILQCEGNIQRFFHLRKLKSISALIQTLREISNL